MPTTISTSTPTDSAATQLLVLVRLDPIFAGLNLRSRPCGATLMGFIYT
jgi:hypothetical protein